MMSHTLGANTSVIIMIMIRFIKHAAPHALHYLNSYNFNKNVNYCLKQTTSLKSVLTNLFQKCNLKPQNLQLF